MLHKVDLAHRRTRPLHRLLVVGAVLALMNVPQRTGVALDAESHRAITLRSLDGIADVDYVMTPTRKELVEFYRWLAFSMAKGGAMPLQERFQKRYPNPDSFDAIGARRFLGLSMSGRADVWAMTRIPDGNAFQRSNLLSLASAYPITDKRCVDPVLMTDDGKPALHTDGQPIPLDPQMLRHGPALGDGSDAWSHDALAVAAPDAVTSIAEPDDSWRTPGWAGPKPINYAAALAQSNVDMAVLARVWGDMLDQIVGEHIATVWLGAGLHYAQDAALPTATAERGGRHMESAVTSAHRWAAVVTGGGYWAPLMDPERRRHRVRRNLDALAQAYIKEQVEAFGLGKTPHPAIAAVMQSIKKDDIALRDELRAQVKPWLNGARFTEPHEGGRGGVTVIVEATAAAAAREAPQMFDVLTQMASPALTSGEQHLQTSAAVTPEHWRGGTPSADPALELALAKLAARAIRRAATASRFVHAVWGNGNSDSAARRLQAARLNHLAAAETRVAKWMKAPDNLLTTVADPTWPILAGLLLLALVFGLFAAIWRTRRSS